MSASRWQDIDVRLCDGVGYDQVGLSGNPAREVIFYELAEWNRHDYPPEAFIWISFDDRMVSTGEFDGKRWWQVSWPPAEFLVRWADRLNVPDAAWLRPFIALLADGVDCRDEAVLEYARRHDGADVPTTIMPM